VKQRASPKCGLGLTHVAAYFTTEAQKTQRAPVTVEALRPSSKRKFTKGTKDTKDSK